MQHTLKIILILLVLLSVACGTSEEEGGGNGGSNQNPGGSNSPVLSTIGNRVLLSGDTLTINLSSTNPNGGNLMWVADGTVGPNNNPLMMGASFNENTGVFSWNDTATAVGSYNIRFTVIDDAVPPQTDSETISIVIQDIFAYGQTSYNSYCRSCHGNEGTGGDEQTLQCIDSPSLDAGMSRSPMNGIGNTWQDYDRELDAILYYLWNVQPQNCVPGGV